MTTSVRYGPWYFCLRGWDKKDVSFCKYLRGVEKEKRVLFCLYKYVFGAFRAKKKLKINLKVDLVVKRQKLHLKFSDSEFPSSFIFF